jgi:hypothetical protein
VGGTRRAGIAGGVAIGVAVVVAHGGCSSSATGAAPLCSPAPTPPSQDPFCTALASYDGRCGHCADCTAKNVQSCAKRSAVLSDAYRAAFVACKDSASCDGDPAFDACITDRMKAATPTAAQNDARTAYCTACTGSNASTCAFFDSKGGPGYPILQYSDAIAASAMTTCKDCDALRYAVCVALVACKPAGGDYCDDGGLCQPQ